MMRSSQPKGVKWALFAAIIVVFPTLILAQVPPPTIDTVTKGNWIGTYGECGYILSGFNSAQACELPILPDGATCLSCPDGVTPICNTCGSYKGGAPQDIVDCRELDLDGDGDQDVFYDVYTGPRVPAGSIHRIMENPDGTCSIVNGIYFGGTMRYQISGVAAGDYRMAIYMMSWDSAARRQSVQVYVGNAGDLLVGDVGSAVVPVNGGGDYSNGVYEFFDVSIAAGDIITVIHTNTAGANAVVSGILFDALAEPPDCGKACYAGASPDVTTRGDWVGVYGADGYIIINRLDPSANLIGGFSSAVVVTPVSGATPYRWNSAGDSCSGTGVLCTDRPIGSGYAMAYTWACNTTDPRALKVPLEGCVNSPACATLASAIAATWDDAGERTPPASGPNLFVDIEITEPGTWLVSVYAVDFDTYARRQKYHLYDFHTGTPIFAPVDIGEYRGGEYVTFALEGPTKVTLKAEYYGGANAIISGIFFDSATGECDQDCCDHCDPDNFCSYTIGGWGQVARGNNVGSMRDANWNTVFPPAIDDPNGYGDLVIGGAPGCYSLTFTGPAAVEAYIPCGGTPAALTQSWVDPLCGKKNTLKNIFANQVTALTLNVAFDQAGVIGEDPVSDLGDLILVSGPFMGMTVNEFLAEAVEALTCGDFEVPGVGTFTASEFSETATAINENFVDCVENEGQLVCPEDAVAEYNRPRAGDCAAHVSIESNVGDDLNNDDQIPDVYPSRDLVFGINVESGAANLTDLEVVNVLPASVVPDLASVAFIPFRDPFVFPQEEWNIKYDAAANTFTFKIGKLMAGAHVAITYNAEVKANAAVGTVFNAVQVTGVCVDGTPVAASDEANLNIVASQNEALAAESVAAAVSWCDYLNKVKLGDYGTVEVEGWLADLDEVSTLFGAMSVQEAINLVCSADRTARPEAALKSNLFVLLLNVSSLNVGLDTQLGDLCPGVAYPPIIEPSMTVREVVAEAERILSTKDKSDPDVKLMLKDAIVAINSGLHCE